jgi:uncharacterized membrane protein
MMSKYHSRISQKATYLRVFEDNRMLYGEEITDVIHKFEKRIVELEKDLNTAESIIVKTANNIIEMDNCEQDSDEMAEWVDCLKEFALLATGRCDT